MGKKSIKVVNIDKYNLEELEGLCIPDNKLDDPLFIEGNMLWKQWIRKNLNKYNSIGKIAYQGSGVVGSIHYIPKPKQKVVEIKCLFVKENGEEEEIKNILLKNTINDFKSSKIYFGNEPALGLVTYTFPFQRYSGQAEFFKENGFEQVSEENPYLLYYPINGDFDPELEYADFPVDDSDKDKVLILCNASCPFCVKDTIETLDKLRKLNMNMSLKIKIPFEETEELTHVYSMPTCIVINDKVVEFSIMDSDKFLKEIKEAIKSEGLVSTFDER